MNPSLENIKDLSVTDDNADGGSLTVEQALANLESADLGLRFYAAWWLGRFRISEPAAVTALIKALEDEADRTPEGGYPLRRNAARALGKLGDRQAVSPLIGCLDCSDFYVREAAAQSLEMLGDPVCIPALIKLLAVGLQGEQLISKQPDLSQPYDAILEALGTLRATEFAPMVKAFLEHPIELVQYSAARAMYQLTQEPVYGERLVKALGGEKLQLRRAVLADLGAIGYLPAADAIAQTLAENSLKLISLKGLLEHQVNHITPSTFSEGAIKVMNLMDSLL
ncbi:HEAT repeat domain-containing protein [Nostoc sphaeroides]|uniref:CpcE, phycocyanobilin lyase subunit alpha n=1 Tax=Nostoc sphaeroides CCNUC1 TaxID=2653204 RepID=A0A5P8W0M4_9NOSO|nr:HEAT repeat domain-containing protein [Nostoc sphaeroides]QFS46257.1 cpcE, phycocyanobilin lyase subunit alpha [Nostoc sphaeroides CCNUC1]